VTQFDVVALLLLHAAIAEFINYKLLRVASAIGLLIYALVLSTGVLLVADVLGFTGLAHFTASVVTAANLPRFLFQDTLGFLLFASALHTNLGDLRSRAPTVLVLATIGVLLATALYGFGIWAILHLFGASTPLQWCVVLGAIIAPTDPIAVTGIMEKLGLPASLRSVVVGESLFNDGVAIVVFTIAVEAASGGSHADISVGHILAEFAREGLGGAALGLVTGWAAYLILRLVDEYTVELIISLALVTVTYAAANAVHMSGPISVVVAGLLIGNRGMTYAMSETTRQNVRLFWSLIDEVLNAVLFLLLGLEMVVIHPPPRWPEVVAAGIGLSLVVRALSTGLPAVPMNLNRRGHGRAVLILTWGGLRGAISVALALSLPDSPYRDTLLTICYGVVVFTILVQGLTLPLMIRTFFTKEELEAE
jgi:CPA1 family monovalent cation:H+ antiporter